MKYDDMPARENNASENEWLSVSFTQSKKIDDETRVMMEGEKPQSVFARGAEKVKALFRRRQKPAPEESLYDGQSDITEEIYTRPVIVREIPRAKFKEGLKTVWQKGWKPAAACLIIALALVGMRYIDNGFVGDVFGYAKETFTSTIANQTDYVDDGNVMTIPSNADVSVSDGDIVLTGGSLAVNFQKGTVKEITDTSVVVSVSDNFDIVYSNLSEVMVKAGDAVEQYGVLGKYGENAVVNLIIGGQKVTGVSADGYTIKWSV